MKRTVFKQRDIADCGAACLASVLAYYRMKVPVINLRLLAGTNKNGTSLLGLIQAAQKLGLEATGVRAAADDLESIPLPCIIHQVKKELHHYVVLYKVGKRSVRIMDPASGKMMCYKKQRFVEEWSGIALLLNPSIDFSPISLTTPLFSRFWQLFWPHSNLIFQALTGALISCVLGIAMAVYLQKITDYVLPSGDLDALRVLSMIMLTVIVAKVLIDVLKELYLLQTAQLMDQRLVMGYYRRLTQMPQDFYDGLQVGELLTRVSDAIKVRNLVNRVGVELIVNVLTLLCAIILLLNYSWKLAIFLAAIAPLFMFIYYIYDRMNKKTERSIMETSASFESRMIEFIKSSRLWRSFGLSALFRERVGGAFYQLLNAVFDSGYNGILAQGASQLTAQIAIVLSLWFGTTMVIGEEISAGELISFYAVTGYFTAPVIRLIQSSKEIQNALIAADRLFELMDSEAGHKKGYDIQTLPSERNAALCIKGLSFSYSGNLPLIHHLDVTFMAGRVYALVGQSGCGKSTLLDLIHGTYSPDDGQISLGHTELSDLNPSSRRKLIGLAREGDALIEGSILENVLLDKPLSMLPDAKRCCREIGADEFIVAHPDRYMKQVGKGGAALSMGQRQRIILARLMLHDPRIFLLDEATSALDALAEKKIWCALEKLKDNGCTVILVSHRMSMVKKADEILVMERGSIIARGGHNELSNINGPYREYCQEQCLLT